MSRQKATLVTNWRQPFEQMESEYGIVSYIEWCNREISRLTKKGIEYFLGQKKGSICIKKRLIEEIK